MYRPLGNSTYPLVFFEDAGMQKAVVATVVLESLTDGVDVFHAPVPPRVVFVPSVVMLDIAVPELL